MRRQNPKHNLGLLPIPDVLGRLGPDVLSVVCSVGREISQLLGKTVRRDDRNPLAG